MRRKANGDTQGTTANAGSHNKCYAKSFYINDLERRSSAYFADPVLTYLRVANLARAMADGGLDARWELGVAMARLLTMEHVQTTGHSG